MTTRESTHIRAGAPLAFPQIACPRELEPDAAVLSHADDIARWTGAMFLHCRPAERGQEVSSAVMDGPQSHVWRQSANRLPTEEALLLALTNAPGHEEGG